MAKLIKNQARTERTDKVTDLSNHSKNVVDQYNQAALEQYSQFLNEVPVFVNYYSKDHFESLADKNLNTVHEVMGDNSPVIFNKLENFPIYRTSRTDLNVSQGNQGDEATAQFQATILPDTIKPMVDDLMTVWYENEQNVFRISDVQRSRLEGKAFYQITAYLYRRDRDLQKLAKQVGKTFVVSRDGKSLNGIDIVTKDGNDEISLLEEIRKTAREYYKGFYDKRVNLFTYRFKDPEGLEQEYVGWDWNVNHFQYKFELFQDRRQLRNEIFIKPLDTFADFNEVTNYSKQIFGNLETGSDVDLQYDTIRLFRDGTMGPGFNTDLFKRYQKQTIRFGLVKSSSITTENVLLTDADYSIEFPLVHQISNNIHQYLVNGDHIRDSEGPSPYIEIIDKYTKNNLSIDEFVQLVEDINFVSGIEDYYFLPTLMFICDKMIEDIRKKGYYSFTPQPVVNNFFTVLTTNPINSGNFVQIKQIPSYFNNIVISSVPGYTQVQLDGQFLLDDKVFSGVPKATDVKQVRSKGTNVFITLNGIGYANLVDPDKYTVFIDSLLKFIIDNDINGINLDLDPQVIKSQDLSIQPSKPISNHGTVLHQISNMVKYLVRELPGLKIMFTSEIKHLFAVSNSHYGMNGELGIALPLYEDLKDLLSFVNFRLAGSDVGAVPLSTDLVLDMMPQEGPSIYNHAYVHAMTHGVVLATSVEEYYEVLPVDPKKIVVSTNINISSPNYIDEQGVKDILNEVIVTNQSPIMLYHFVEEGSDESTTHDIALTIIDIMKQINQ